MESDSIGVASRRLPFTLIENVVLEDLELGPVDVLVYIALAKHADREGTCWPSMATIGKLARCARQTVARSIAHLEARGYLKRTARFRPDGGVTSNVYQLMTLKAERHPPVTQDDTPCPPARQAPVIDGDTNYIQSERDQKKGGARDAHCAPLPASHPENQVIKELAEIPDLVHDRRFREGCRRLLAEGIPPAQLVQAVKAAAEDPRERGGLSFIADRFPRWQRKTRELKKRLEAPTVEEREEKERRYEEDRARIMAEQDSDEGRALVAAACARLPWRR
jgi:GntR family transcriptional regulator